MNENINLINEHNYNSNNNIININNNKSTIYHDNNKSFFCELHKELYPNIEYEEHFKTHEKHKKFQDEYNNKSQLKTNTSIYPNEFNQNKIINNFSEKNETTKQNFNQHFIDNNYNEDMIKCSECNLFFNSVELLSVHYYETHEKNNSKNNNNKNPFNNNISERNNENKFGIKKEKKQEKEIEEESEEELKIEKEKNDQEEIDIKNHEEKEELSEENETKEEEKEYKKFPFYCDICEKGFHCYKALKDHNKAKRH